MNLSTINTIISAHSASIILSGIKSVDILASIIASYRLVAAFGSGLKIKPRPQSLGILIAGGLGREPRRSGSHITSHRVLSIFLNVMNN